MNENNPKTEEVVADSVPVTPAENVVETPNVCPADPADANQCDTCQ